LKTNELTGLINEHGHDYIRQLATYINYKSKIEKIGSIKSYIFGILKNKPLISDLKTPQCLIKTQVLEKKKQL